MKKLLLGLVVGLIVGAGACFIMGTPQKSEPYNVYEKPQSPRAVYCGKLSNAAEDIMRLRQDGETIASQLARVRIERSSGISMRDYELVIAEAYNIPVARGYADIYMARLEFVEIISQMCRAGNLK